MSDSKLEQTNEHLKNGDVCKYLTFWSNGNIFAVSTFDVLQIIEMTFITPIPETPDYIRGILHLRGHNIPIIDLGLRLHETAVEKSESARIVMLSTKEGDIGLIVEAIGEIVDLTALDISDVPRLAVTIGKHTLSGIAMHQDKLIPILDIIALLADKAICEIDLDQV